MNRCEHCGAPVSVRDETCSYCGARNAGHQPMEAKRAVLFARGMEAYRGGKHASAIESLVALLADEPDAFDAYFYLCASWDALGSLGEAAAAMRRAIAVRGGSASAHYNLGDILARQGERDPARAALQAARRLADTDPRVADRAALKRTIEARLAKVG